MSKYTWFGETKRRISNTETSENPTDSKLNSIIQRLEFLENKNRIFNEKVIYLENELNKINKNDSVVDTAVSTQDVNDDECYDEIPVIVIIICGKKYLLDRNKIIYDYSTYEIVSNYERVRNEVNNIRTTDMALYNGTGN